MYVRAIETTLSPYREVAGEIAELGDSLREVPTLELERRAAALRHIAPGRSLDELLPETFALVREVANRVLGIRPFDVQVMAGVALHAGKMVEMQTGEGKTCIRRETVCRPPPR